jgi:hypothetical protein
VLFDGPAPLHPPLSPRGQAIVPRSSRRATSQSPPRSMI